MYKAETCDHTGMQFDSSFMLNTVRVRLEARSTLETYTPQCSKIHEWTLQKLETILKKTDLHKMLTAVM
jgi:hypothetical protein